MRLITWNTHNRRDTRSQAEFLGKRNPDVVALQEVTPRSLESWKGELPKIGLLHVKSPVREPMCGNSGVLIASKAPVEMIDDGAIDTDSKWPNCHSSLSSVVAKGVRLHTACLYGECPDQNEVIHASMSRRAEAPTILAGDLHGNQSSDDPIALKQFGMRDVYLELHGIDEAGYSYVTNRGETRRNDHVFASHDLAVLSAKYWTEKMGTIAEGGLSDHAALEVVFDL